MKARIKPEYCESKEESKLIFEVLEDNKDRCLIRPVKYPYSLVPTERIKKEYLEILD